MLAETFARRCRKFMGHIALPSTLLACFLAVVTFVVGCSSRMLQWWASYRARLCPQAGSKKRKCGHNFWLFYSVAADVVVAAPWTAAALRPASKFIDADVANLFANCP